MWLKVYYIKLNDKHAFVSNDDMIERELFIYGSITALIISKTTLVDAIRTCLCMMCSRSGRLHSTDYDALYMYSGEDTCIWLSSGTNEQRHELPYGSFLHPREDASEA